MPRKVPFSGRKKREQLLAKRHGTANTITSKPIKKRYEDDDDGSDDESDIGGRATVKLMAQPHKNRSGRDANRYNLQFFKETKDELEAQRNEGFAPFELAKPEERELGADYFTGYDFPIRPEWSYDMKKDTLERNENRYFREYVDQLMKLHQDRNKELSLFELNLETWRQLWRVLEFSDVLLIIVDARYPTLMFPPSLHHYIRNTIKKHDILVLNKVDLVPPEVVVAWREYLRETYPDLPVVYFTSNPERGKRKFSDARKQALHGVLNIYKECQKIVKTAVDLSAWEKKILEDLEAVNESTTELEGDPSTATTIDENLTDFRDNVQKSMFPNGVLTIGCIGFPNVGKSSLINALKGRKVVSVHSTPGHTKHFQTIFLTNNVRLCDCPGLVFPSSTPKRLQVLIGSFPIAQLQVPYRSLRFLAQHLDLTKALKIQLPEDFEKWSAVAVTEAWATKRGFLTAKSARPDRYRAANHLLRMCVNGKQNLVLYFYPPGFIAAKDNWLQHPEVEEVRKYQSSELQDLKEESDEEQAEDGSSDNTEDDEGAEDGDSSDEESDGEGAVKAKTTVKKNRPTTSNAFALLEDD